MKEIRWGFVGCGDVTEVKSGPAFSKIPGSKVVAVMRRDAAKAAEYARRHGISKFYTSAEELINDPEVNAVYIATPPSSHAHYALMAARAGKPAYVEKPMAMNTEECRQMIDEFEAAGVPLFVAYYRRCLPYFMKVKELVDSGAIGRVTGVNIRLSLAAKPEDLQSSGSYWRTDPAVAGGGHFHDLASHQFDFLNFLLGTTAGDVTGSARNLAGRYSAPDVLSALWTHPGNVAGSGYWNFTSTHTSDIDETEITGTEGRIRFAFFSPAPVLLENREGLQQFAIPHPPHVQQPMIENVVNSLLSGTGPVCTGKEALHATACLDAIAGKKSFPLN